jgi:hypothetical protein
LASAQQAFDLSVVEVATAHTGVANPATVNIIVTICRCIFNLPINIIDALRSPKRSDFSPLQDAR